MNLPIDIFQNVIFNFCDGDEQILLKKILYDGKLEITNLYDISDKVRGNLTNEYLLKCQKLEKLNIKNNHNIDGNVLRQLQLNILDISNTMICINDIKHMDLEVLHAVNTSIAMENCKIFKNLIVCNTMDIEAYAKMYNLQRMMFGRKGLSFSD